MNEKSTEGPVTRAIAGSSGAASGQQAQATTPFAFDLLSELLFLAKRWSDNEVHVYQFVTAAEQLFGRAITGRSDTASDEQAHVTTLFAVDLLSLTNRWSNKEIQVCQFITEAEQLFAKAKVKAAAVAVAAPAESPRAMQ